MVILCYILIVIIVYISSPWVTNVDLQSRESVSEAPFFSMPTSSTKTSTKKEDAHIKTYY